MADAPRTRYARNGDVHIGFQVLGSGAVDLVQIGSGVFASVAAFDDEPHAARFEERLASMARVTRFDMRGIGMSDPLPGPPTLEEQLDDLIAVMDASAIDTAVLYGAAFGGPTALAAALRIPERIAGLILSNTTARNLEDVGYSGISHEDLELRRASITQPPTTDDEEILDSSAVIMPSLGDDARFRQWWARSGSQGASPRSAYMQYEPLFQLDLRDQLSRISVPTLVLESKETSLFSDHGKYLAANIPDARFVSLPSADRLLFGANAERALDEIEEFLTGARTGVGRDRVLATLLFTDIVESTRQLAALGDNAWRAALDTHDAIVRAQLRRYGGHEVNTTGDGFLASFDGTASAVRCAVAISEAASTAGISIRAGIHTGECERRGDDLAGLAVHIAARVAALAGADEILVSRTVKDLVVGSDLRFELHGEYELKGVPDRWQIYILETT
jgi:class 3 adenylate cyclase